jgi:nucleotide-binding universal stress UspA family protein
MEIKRILFATDFSEASESALHMAASLARDNHAKLIVLHASQAEDSPMGELVDEDPRPPRDEAEQLEKIASGLKNIDCETRWIHCEGTHEGDVIVKAAAKESVDLIVLGTHGHKGLSHLLMGGVAEKVIRNATCPVMSIRPMKPVSR